MSTEDPWLSPVDLAEGELGLRALNKASGLRSWRNHLRVHGCEQQEMAAGAQLPNSAPSAPKLSFKH